MTRAVSAGVGDSHVNTLSCTAPVGADWIHQMRSDYELPDPTRLRAVARLINAVDGVYGAYRVIPGKA